MDWINFLLTILGYILVPISSIITFYASRHARHNENLNSFQETMDKLLKKNSDLSLQVTELNAKVMELSNENRQLKQGQEQMLAEISRLKPAKNQHKTKRQ